MNKQPMKPATDDSAMFARIQSAKGVTLSAGPAKQTVVATGQKTPVSATVDKIEADRANKPLSKRAQKAAAKEAAKLEAVAKAATKELVETGTLNALPKSTPVTAEPALGPDGQPLEKVRRSIVPMKFKERYKSHGGTCGDDVSLELKAATTTRNADKREVLDVEALWAIAKANEIDVSRYVDLNNGQKRMNVGNKLRGALAAGRDVVIGTRTFKAEDFTPKG